MNPATVIPLSLYIHIPWCVKKCPYCDFNSHEASKLPETAYVDTLLDDLDQDLDYLRAQSCEERPIHSIFIGGGTPSLFSGASMKRMMDGISSRMTLTPDAEITIEANPGTLDNAAVKFPAYLDAGINRLSLGAQSFDNHALRALGRIHESKDVDAAFDAARKAGFQRINIDLMHGLPRQTLDLAIKDLRGAIELGADHISWYQLTIEPNTVFYSRPPELPGEDTLAEILDAGSMLLADKGYQRYEVSAFAQPGQQSRHNLNYWRFGDYLGIGAGAHGKVSMPDRIERSSKTRLPRDYLDAPKVKRTSVETDALPLEFLMNALRLPEGFSFDQFEERTRLNRKVLSRFIGESRAKEMVTTDGEWIKPTSRGLDYLNDLLLIADERTMARGQVR